MHFHSDPEKPDRIEPEDICEGEWADWYRLTPLERWRETEKLWAIYLSLGGSLDPEPDTQSPFHDALAAFDQLATDANSDEKIRLRMTRRGGV